MTALSDRLSAANVEGRSAREISRTARQRGFTLNHDTATRYLRGDHGRPSEPTLVAFADVLGVPLADLRRAAHLPAESVQPYVPPDEASRLSRRQRKAVDEIIRAMLEPGAAKADGRTTRRAPTPITARRTSPPGPAAGSRAARRGRAEPPTD